MTVTFNPARDLEEKLQLVAQTGLLLARHPRLEAVAQRATDTGLQVSAATFGSFILNDGALPHTASFVLYTVSDIASKRVSSFPARQPLPTAPPLREKTTIRSRDITRDVRFRGPIPNDGLPHDNRTIRSYLAVPIRNISGDVLGALVYGHEDPDVFDDNAELLVSTLASQTAAALELSRNNDQLSSRIADIDRIQLEKAVDTKRLGELAAIVESSDDAIISKDLNGTITSWNAAATRILGYQPEEIMGRSILTLIPEHLHSDEPIIISRIKSGQRIEHFETQRRHKNGDLLDVSLTISPVKDARGNIIGASKILRDISPRKRLETSLIQAEKIAATGRMAATIAHEINNPLEAVLNLLYLLRPLVTNDVGRSYLSTAEVELNRVAHIAKQTLGYYREHSSAVRISVSELAEHALVVYGPRCSASDVKIEQCLQSQTKLVLRRGEMMQVISNLIANSIYAMPRGGKLRVSVTEVQTPQPGVVLTVEDNGVGIAPENLGRVFEAFFTTRQTIGTGIGLFVAKQFVEGHGGSIAVESSTKPEDHGTTVSVFLPLHTTYELVEDTTATRA